MRDFVEIFHRLETEYEARELRCGDIRIWPLVKFLLAREIFDYVKEKKLNHLTHGFNILNKMRFAAQVAADSLTNISVPERPADICLFTYEAFRHYQVGVRWFNVFQDPLIDVTDESRLSLATLELLSVFPGRRPKLHATRSVTAGVIRAQLAAKLPFLRAAGLAAEIQSVCDWLDAISHVVGKEESAAVRAALRSAVPALFSMSQQLERHLRRIQPRLGLLANYYSTSGLAFCLACHRCGIRCADISHGASGEYHYAYGGWGAAPPGGYELLPTDFLSRTEEDAFALRSLLAGHTDAREPVVVGDLAAHAWRANAFGIADAPRAMLDAVRPRGADQRMEVLVAAQNVEVLPGVITDAIAANRDRCFFWIRFHPIYLSYLKNFSIDLPSGCYNLVEATRPPPFALLERVGAVMTESSSVADDARAWGVKSIIVHEFGAKLYAQQIKAGQMIFADTAPAVGAALAHLASRHVEIGNTCDTSALDGQRDNLLRFVALARHSSKG